jgi:hypothetical protein
MWIKGNQEEKPNDKINVELLTTLEDHMEEREAKVLLYRFLKENLTYSANLIMGVDLFPFQHMAVKGMFKSDYFLGIWSRGLSKSWSTGIFAALYAIFNQGVNIGILSKTFRQSKHIFRKIEDISKTPEAAFLQQCITHVSRSNDEWIMSIGESKIIALPLGDGEKLRGFRFHVMIIDELLLMPEKILNEVIMPFLSTVEDPVVRQKMHDAETDMIEAGLLEEKDRTQWPSNKLVGLSSASYKFEYLYKLYTEYEDLILHPEKAEKDEELEHVHRVIMHFSYDVAPTKLYDQKLINQSKATMSQAQFEREFGSKFTDDSSGYFKISKMAACTFEDGQPPSVEIVGEKDDEYILAVDPSWSESESSDDFAMQVIKLDKEKKKGILVHSYAMSGTNLKKHIAYFLYILEHFNIVSIVMDYNGGVQFLSAVNESALFKQKGIKVGVIEDVAFDDPTEYQKDVRDYKRKYNKDTCDICYLRKPSSSWIRIANESLQAAFDHKRMLFAGMAIDDEYYKQIKYNPDISNLVFLRKDELHEKGNESRVVDFVENQKDNVELTKTECALIEVSSSPQGNQTFDLPLSLRKLGGKEKARKDSYSALLLGNWMMERYFDMQDFDDDVQFGFEPIMI